jgi:hypothetical protein
MGSIWKTCVLFAPLCITQIGLVLKGLISSRLVIFPIHCQIKWDLEGFCLLILSGVSYFSVHDSLTTWKVELEIEFLVMAKEADHEAACSSDDGVQPDIGKLPIIHKETWSQATLTIWPSEIRSHNLTWR